MKRRHLLMVPQLVITTGLSGSGMSSAMNVFEDLGYFCVDNLPVQLIPSFIHLFEHRIELRVLRWASISRVIRRTLESMLT
jgi:RNase adaptor protein for sRNA GlmZ degradation